MSDNYGARCKRCDIRQPTCCGMCTVCVSELEAENAKLKEALQKIYDNAGDHDLIVDVASAALEGKQDGM